MLSFQEWHSGEYVTAASWSADFSSEEPPNNSSRNTLVKFTSEISVVSFKPRGFIQRKFFWIWPVLLIFTIYLTYVLSRKKGFGLFFFFWSHILILSKGFYRKTFLCSLRPSEACNFCWVWPQWLNSDIWFWKWAAWEPDCWMARPWPFSSQPTPTPSLPPLAETPVFPPQPLSRTGRACRVTERLWAHHSSSTLHLVQSKNLLETRLC